jgi:hypothetical protein
MALKATGSTVCGRKAVQRVIVWAVSTLPLTFSTAAPLTVSATSATFVGSRFTIERWTAPLESRDAEPFRDGKVA